MSKLKGYKSRDLKVTTKVVATTKYVLGKKEEIVISAMKSGKELELMYREHGRIRGLFTSKELLDLYGSAEDSIEVLLGVEFIKHHKLIPSKTVKLVESTRTKAIAKLDKEAMHSFVETVKLIQEDKSALAGTILDKLRKIIK